KDPLLNLTVRHQVDGFEVVVTKEGIDDFGEIFARERLAAGENQHAEVAAQRLRNAIDFMGLHLKFLARPIVELVGEETMRAAHITNRGNQYIKKHGCEGLTQSHFCITLQ